jgi:hypothetical protein
MARCATWRAVDHEGEILESFVTKERDKAEALKFMKKALKRHGSPEAITTDGLRSYKAAMTGLGNIEKQDRTLDQQPGGELAPVVSTTRTGDAEVPMDGVPAKVRIRPRQRPQPLKFRTPPRRRINLQATPLGSPCRVAVAVRLNLPIKATRPPIGEKCALV